MHFAIRFLTEYHYDAPVTDNLNALRVRPATTSTQRCDEFHTRIDPEARVSRHLDYFGTEVLEFGIPTSHEQLTIDVRARVVTSAPPIRRRALGGPAQRRRTSTPRASSRCPGRTSRRCGLETSRTRSSTRGRPLSARTALRADPRPLRVSARGDVRGSTFERPARNGRRASARTSPTSRCCCCAAAASPRATSRATCGRRRRTRARTRSRSTRTRGSRRCCRARRPRRAGVGGRRPDQPPPDRRDAREDRPRPLLRRRAAGQGPLSWAARTRGCSAR